MPRIHPTAVVDPSARLADDVEIGPCCVVEGDVEIGPGTVLRERASIRRYTTLGAGNFVDANVVLGGEPQDLKFDKSAVTYLRIGDRNVFRESVTISRATKPGGATVVGNRTYWMTCSHAGHDAVVKDEAILINGSALAGHTELGRRAILSAHVVIHQFCWIGDLTLGQGNGASTQHIPPYVIYANISDIIGLNVVGLRRAPWITDEDRRQIREAFDLLYRSHLMPPKALEAMDACRDWGAAAVRFRDFVRRVLEAPKPFHRGLGKLLHGRHAETED